MAFIKLPVLVTNTVSTTIVLILAIITSIASDAQSSATAATVNRSGRRIIAVGGTREIPRRDCIFLSGVVFETPLPAQIAAVFEHVTRVRVKRPKRALSWPLGRAAHFDETIVVRQRVPHRVLPPLLIMPIKRISVHDVIIDLRQRQHLYRRVLYSHRYERYVRQRRFRIVPGIVRLPDPLKRGARGGRVSGSERLITARTGSFLLQCSKTVYGRGRGTRVAVQLLLLRGDAIPEHMMLSQLLIVQLRLQ